MSEYNKIQHHLQDGKRWIKVTDLATEKELYRQLFLDDINTQFGSLEGFFESLIKKGYKELQIEMRRKNGTSSILCAPAQNIRISEEVEHQEIKEPAPKTQPVLAEQYPMHYPQQHYALNAPVQPMTYDLYKEKYIDLQERYVDLKEENRDLKAKNRKLRESNWDLESRCKTFDREKELDMKLLEISKASFWESEAGKTVIENGLGLAESMVAKKEIVETGLSSASENPKHSQTKRALLMMIEQGHVTDAHCEALYYTLAGYMQQGSAFADEHKELLLKHNLKNQGNV